MINSLHQLHGTQCVSRSPAGDLLILEDAIGKRVDPGDTDL